MSRPARTAPPPEAAAERERVLALLRAHADAIRARGVTRLALFGSVARGEAEPGSDVDLLIEELDRARHLTLFDLVDLQDELRALLGRPAHFAFTSKLRPWLREEIGREAGPAAADRRAEPRDPARRDPAPNGSAVAASARR